MEFLPMFDLSRVLLIVGMALVADEIVEVGIAVVVIVVMAITTGVTECSDR